MGFVVAHDWAQPIVDRGEDENDCAVDSTNQHFEEGLSGGVLFVGCVDPIVCVGESDERGNHQ